jgi:hypothetical protein
VPTNQSSIATAARPPGFGMVRGAAGSNSLVPASNHFESFLELGTSRACGRTLGRPIRPPFLPRVILGGGEMLDSVRKVERYRKEANRCAELAKEASPPFLAEIYRKVAVRYVFMAEELLKGPARDEDAIERADRMISRLRPDAAIEGPGGYRARGSAPAGMRR